MNSNYRSSNNASKKLKAAALVVALFALMPFINKAQTISWENNYSISGSALTGQKIATHSSGYYAAIKEVNSAGKDVLRVTKFNSSGTAINSYGFVYGLSSKINAINKILVDASGNAYVMITIYSTATTRTDTYIYSFTSSLAFRWVNIIDFGFKDVGVDMVFSAGGKLLAMVNYATTSTAALKDVGIKKLSTSTGLISQTINHITSNRKTPIKLAEDASGNIYYCGYYRVSSDLHTGMLTQFNSAGTFMWTKSYSNGYPPSSASSRLNQFTDMVFDNSGNIFIGGDGGYNGVGYSRGAYIRKYSSSGSLLAHVGYNVSGDSEYGINISRDASGNILYTGVTGYHIVWYIKYNSSLSTLLSWGTRTIPHIIYADQKANFGGVLFNTNGSVVIALNTISVGGSTNYSSLVKFNTSGGVVFENHRLGSYPKLTSAITSLPNEDFAVLGNYSGVGTCVLRKYNGPAARFANDETELLTSNETQINIYPNPATSEINISGVDDDAQIMLFDIAGKLALQQKNNSNKKIETGFLPRGIYYLKVTSVDGKNYSQKVVLN